MDGFETKKYRYQQSWGTVISILLIMSLLTIFAYIQAVNKDTMIEFYGLVLDIEQSSVAFWCITIFCGLIFLLGLISFYFRLKETNYLEIHEDHLIIPPVGFNRKTYNIDFDNVILVKELDFGFQKMIQIDTTTGKRAIPKVLLANKTQYKEVLKLLKELTS